MLQTIRDNAQGWIAWVIVGLIILTFALFGIDQYARGDKVVVVAEVNGEDITARDFLMLYNRQKSRLEQQFGDMYTQVVQDEDLRDQVLDALIESEVIRQWAHDNSMTISDQQLARTIQSAEVFQQEGQFSQKIYEDIIMRNGLNVARFEYEQRQFLVEEQYKMLTQSSTFATQSEIDQLARLQGQERNVNYLRINQRPFLKTVTVTDEEISDFYDANKAQYIEPEQVVIDYIEVSQSELAEQVAVNDEIIQKYYDENKSLFMMPEKRQAKHILINLDADTVEAESAAMKTVNEIQAKIEAGESFSELAKAYSKDSGSAETGGDLGSFEQGMMVPEFDAAVFSMEVNEISEPVKTDFGLHLIKLVSIEEAQYQPLTEVRSEVAEQYQLQEAEKQYFDLLEQVNTIAYEQADSLVPVVDATGLIIKTSEPFSRDGGEEGVTSNLKVVNAAFSEDVLKSRLNSASIEVAANDAVVLRVNKFIESRQKTLAEVSSGIKENLERQAAIKAAASLGETLFAKLSEGENPESLMADGVEWNTIGWVDRNTQSVQPQILSEVFKDAKPVDGKPTWRSVQLDTGDTALIQVTEIRNREVTDAERVQLEGAISEMMATNELDFRLKAALSEAKVTKRSNYKTMK